MFSEPASHMSLATPCRKVSGDLRFFPSHLISYNWILHQMDTISWSLPLI